GAAGLLICSIMDFKKINKFKEQKMIDESTLHTDKDIGKKFKKFTYHPLVFDKFKKIFNIKLAPKNAYIFDKFKKIFNIKLAPKNAYSLVRRSAIRWRRVTKSRYVRELRSMGVESNGKLPHVQFPSKAAKHSYDCSERPAFGQNYYADENNGSGFIAENSGTGPWFQE
ncbi:hypothetical protein L9F63_015581, partial [Diploptera punctata]